MVAAGIGIGVSTSGWFLVAAREESFAKQELTETASNYAYALQGGLNEHVSKLYALRALFNASRDEVDRKEFGLFTTDLREERRAILSFSWIPRVRREERAAHELAGAHDGIPNYQIKAVTRDGSLSPSPEREEYFPIFYTQAALIAHVYGLDLRDGGIRQAPIDRARDGDYPAASTGFQLQSVGDGDRRGFFIVLPVYRRDMPHDTLEDRRSNLKGFVQAVFQIGIMADTALYGMTAPLDIFLFDTDAAAGDMPVHVHASRTRGTPLASKSLALLAAGPHWSGHVSAGDRRWRLMAVPTPGEIMLARYDRAWIVFGGGLLITALVLAYMMASVRHMRRLEAANNKVAELAKTDALTHLANRRAFVERLCQDFAAARRGAAPFAVLCLDLDDFKDVNDTLGHATGDALLKLVVERLGAAVRETDLVARFGGDEFAILQTNAADPAASGTLAAKIIRALAVPYTIERNELRITVSIGISTYDEAIAGPEAMMMQADLALYRAKDDGRNCYRFHSGELDQQVRLRVTLAEELRGAIDRDELELHYQPQAEIGTGRIIGMEALVRWNHPARGLIMPSIFLPVAERTGGMLALGQWVLDRACRQLRDWRDQGIAPPLLAVNVSGAQLRRPADFERAVAETLARWSIPPGAIELELTETVLMELAQRRSDTLEHLQQLGARIAIDDFGLAYSSLRSLTSHPVHRLKIAEDLVARVTTDSRNAVVVRAAIHLAHDLGIDVIAQGVETEAQASFLLAAGCGQAQGQYYGRAASAEQATALLRRRMPLSPDTATETAKPSAA